MSETFRIVGATTLDADPWTRGVQLEGLKLLVVTHAPGDFLLFTEDGNVVYRLRPN